MPREARGHTLPHTVSGQWGNHNMMGFPRQKPMVVLGLTAVLLAGCSTPRESEINNDLPPHMQFGFDAKGRVVTNYKVGTPYEVAGQWYYPAEDYGYREEGIASWYGPGFHGKRTANGEIYDMNALTAAHKTLPMPSIVRVTSLENGRSLKVRINDRGPFVDGRIIDLSRRSAQLLGMELQGTARVMVEVIPDESMTMKNIAMGQSELPSMEVPDVSAAPRDPVVAEPLDPPSFNSNTGASPRPTNVASRPNPRSPTVSRPQSPSPPRPSAPRPSTPTVSQPSPPSAPSMPSRPSVPSRPTVSQPAVPSQPTSGITQSPLPSPPTQPPPVSTSSLPSPTPSSPSVSASSGGSGLNLPSVNVSTPDVTPLAKSAVNAQTAMAPSPQDLLPSPKDMLNRALEEGEQDDAVGQDGDPAAENRLDPPSDIQLPQGVFIQAGAFSDLNNARRLEAQLSGLGNVFVAMVEVGGQVFHRVRVGPIPDRAVADQLLQFMQTEGFGEARIVEE